jgi:hypothetical protein
MTFKVGDFVEFDRSHLIDKEGIIVSRYINGYDKDNDYTYLISIRQFSGDFCCMKSDCITGYSEGPLENKLSYILSFDDWWFNSYKNLFQDLLIQIINK